jgi:hypothetical protein
MSALRAAVRRSFFRTACLPAFEVVPFAFKKILDELVSKTSTNSLSASLMHVDVAPESTTMLGVASFFFRFR